MSKPNPFYRSAEEKAVLLKLKSVFAFDEVPPPNVLILIAGPPAAGKTHLACSMAELGPVYLLDTEYRAHLVSQKFENIKRKVVTNYQEMVVAIKYIIDNFEPPGTIVIDSASDLQQFAEELYCDRADKERVGLPRNWGDVWELCNAVISLVKFSDFNLVCTARVKEEYANDKATGKEVPRIYSALPYKMDLSLQLSGDIKEPPVLLKNGFDRSVDLKITRNMTLPEILAVTIPTPTPEEIISHAQRKTASHKVA